MKLHRWYAPPNVNTLNMQFAHNFPFSPILCRVLFSTLFYWHNRHNQLSRLLLPILRAILFYFYFFFWWDKIRKGKEKRFFFRGDLNRLPKKKTMELKNQMMGRNKRGWISSIDDVGQQGRDRHNDSKVKGQWKDISFVLFSSRSTPQPRINLLKTDARWGGAEHGNIYTFVHAARTGQVSSFRLSTFDEFVFWGPCYWKNSKAKDAKIIKFIKLSVL